MTTEEGSPDLAALIEAYRERTGDSYGTIAARTNLARPTLWKIANVPLKTMPRPETIRQLARTLSLSERTVRDAALRSVGLPTEARNSGSGAPELPDCDLEEIQELLARLRPEQYSAVRTLLRSMVSEAE